MAIHANAIVVLGKKSKEISVAPVAETVAKARTIIGSINANNFVVLNKKVEETPEPVKTQTIKTPVNKIMAEKPKRIETPVTEDGATEPKGLFAHKNSQFLHDMLKEQN